jgi:hypothetical protein
VSTLVLLGALAAGCRRPDTCVPVIDDATGEPRRIYDEFTQITSLVSWFVFTPDQEWELRDERYARAINWSLELWLRGGTHSPTIELTLRAICSHQREDDDSGKCVNCDTVCSEQSGGLELLADGYPLQMPPVQYQRVPVGQPNPESPGTWASTMTMFVPPEALWPLAQARVVKLRVCGAIVVTLSPADLANLQEYLRHHHALAPQAVPPMPPAPGQRR